MSRYKMQEYFHLGDDASSVTLLEDKKLNSSPLKLSKYLHLPNNTFQFYEDLKYYEEKVSNLLILN